MLLGRKPHGLKSFRLGSPPRALMGSPHYQTCAGTPGRSGSSSQPRVTSSRPLGPEGGVVGLPGTSPLGRPGCGIPWAWDPLGLGFFTPRVSPSALLIECCLLPQGWSGSTLPGWGSLSSGSGTFPAGQPLGGHPCSVKHLSLVPVCAEAAQAGRLVPWQGEGRAVAPRRGGALCQPLWPAPSVWGCVTQVDGLTADRSPAGRPPRGRMWAWTSWAHSGKAGWAVQGGHVPWSLELSRPPSSGAGLCQGQGFPAVSGLQGEVSCNAFLLGPGHCTHLVFHTKPAFVNRTRHEEAWCLLRLVCGLRRRSSLMAGGPTSRFLLFLVLLCNELPRD